MKEEEKLLNFEAKLQYIFNDISLLKTALTHKSYAYEGVSKAKKKYNERIEFLGDAILEHIISDLLYNHKPEFSEGDMTKIRASIVCEKSLTKAMQRIEGQNYLYLGKCEKSSNGRFKDAILADAFEAVIPDSTPKTNDRIEAITNATPIFSISFISPAYIPLSINSAISNGIITSIITSNVTSIGVTNAGLLYSLTDFPSVFIMSIIIFLPYLINI